MVVRTAVPIDHGVFWVESHDRRAHHVVIGVQTCRHLELHGVEQASDVTELLSRGIVATMHVVIEFVVDVGTRQSERIMSSFAQCQSILGGRQWLQTYGKVYAVDRATTNLVPQCRARQAPLQRLLGSWAHSTDVVQDDLIGGVLGSE